MAKNIEHDLKLIGENLRLLSSESDLPRYCEAFEGITS